MKKARTTASSSSGSCSDKVLKAVSYSLAIQATTKTFVSCLGMRNEKYFANLSEYN